MADSLKAPLKKTELIIAQHINYVDRLKKSLRDGTPFNHRDCTQCDFGQFFYEEIWPKKDSYPSEVFKLLETIEKLEPIERNRRLFPTPYKPTFDLKKDNNAFNITLECNAK